MIVVATSGHKPDDERVYHREIKSLLNAGYNILYCTRWDGDMDLSEEHLRHINVSRSATPIKNYIQIIQDEVSMAAPADILHIHEFDLLPLAKQMKKKLGIKVIYDVHDTLRAMWATFSSKKGIMKKAINKALSFFETSHIMYVDEVILANRVIGQNYYEEKGLSTTVVENFPRKDRLSDTKQLAGTPLILYQGQISADRGITLLVDAFAIVKKEFPDVKLRIIGTFRHPRFKKELIDKINLSDFNAAIELHPEVPHNEIWKHMQAAHIGVIPSFATPRVSVDTPTKMFEYMASGCAVVATDVPPVRHFLDGAGVLINPNDVEALAEGIISILSNRPMFYELTTESQKRIQEQFNWEAIKDKFLAVYEKKAE